MKNAVLNIKRFTYTAAILAFALFLCILMPIAIKGAGNYNCISAITLNKSQTELSVEISISKDYVKENKGAELYLFELFPYSDTEDIGSLTPIAAFKANSKQTVKIPFEHGNVSRFYSSFAVAEKTAGGNYRLITEPHFVDNFSDYAKNSEEFPTGSSKKGLRIGSFADAQLLGVQHTVIDIAVNEYMLGEMRDGAASFVWGGRTFYIDESKLLSLDHKVKSYTEAGINVYFNILLTAPQSDYHSDILSLYFDGASSDATYYGINTASETAVNVYSAFMEYICSRYTSPEHTYGFVPAIILGYEVNRGSKWSNYGSASPSSYIESYCAAFRIAHTALCSNYSEGRVYVSLGNNFNASASETDMTAKYFLDSFAEKMKLNGDIPWGLSINPYPSEGGLVDYWNDGGATDSYSTEYITMKNINILSAYMNEEEFLYNGEARSIIVGEFGIHGSPEDDNSMTMQAAAYALAYYTAEQSKDIDAFIYYRQVDASDEAYNYGLWTQKADASGNPAAKKPIYNVFSLIDTERSEGVTAFVKQSIGDSAFNALVGSNVKYKNFNGRTLINEVAVSSSDFTKGYKKKTLFDLTRGKYCNFYFSDDTEYMEFRSPGSESGTRLYARITDIPTEYKGIGNGAIEDDAFKGAHYITVRVMVESPETVTSADVMLRLQKNGNSQLDAAVFEGTAQVRTNEWHDLSFKIDEITKITEGDIDLMKLWVLTDDENAKGEYGIWLETVILHTKGGVSFIGGFFIFILVVAGLAALAYGALYFRAQYIRRQRREAKERMRREQFRRQAMNHGHQYTPPPYRGDIQSHRPEDDR